MLKHKRNTILEQKNRISIRILNRQHSRVEVKVFLKKKLEPRIEFFEENLEYLTLDNQVFSRTRITTMIIYKKGLKPLTTRIIYKNGLKRSHFVSNLVVIVWVFKSFR